MGGRNLEKSGEARFCLLLRGICNILVSDNCAGRGRFFFTVCLYMIVSLINDMGWLRLVGSLRL